MTRMARCDPCKDSLTHVSYDDAESPRVSDRLCRIRMRNSLRRAWPPGKTSVRRGPSEGPSHRRGQTEAWEVTARLLQQAKAIHEGQKQESVANVIRTVCSEQNCGAVESLFKTKAQEKWQPLFRYRVTAASGTGVPAPSALLPLPVTRMSLGFPVTHPAAEAVWLTEGLGCEDPHPGHQTMSQNPTGLPQSPHRIASSCRCVHM